MKTTNSLKSGLAHDTKLSALHASEAGNMSSFPKNRLFEMDFGLYESFGCFPNFRLELNPLLRAISPQMYNTIMY